MEEEDEKEGGDDDVDKGAEEGTMTDAIRGEKRVMIRAPKEGGGSSLSGRNAVEMKFCMYMGGDTEGNRK